MTPTTKFWLAVVGIGLTGVVTRCSFLLLGDRLVLPRGVERALRHAPAAALAAIVAPGMLLAEGHIDLSPGNPRLGAGIVAALVMWRTRGMLWSMAAGVAVYTALRLLWPA
jgi:branched-subunit amino acid transport protein